MQITFKTLDALSGFHAKRPVKQEKVMDYSDLTNAQLLDLLACTGRGSNSEFKIRSEIARRGLRQPK